MFYAILSPSSAGTGWILFACFPLYFLTLSAPLEQDDEEGVAAAPTLRDEEEAQVHLYLRKRVLKLVFLSQFLYKFVNLCGE